MIRKKMKTASELIKIIGKQKDLLEEVDEAIRSFNAGDLDMRPDDFEELVDDFYINNKKLSDSIKHILFSFREQQAILDNSPDIKENGMYWRSDL